MARSESDSVVDLRCQSVLRRDLLRIGGLSAFGFGLNDLFRLQRISAAEGTSPTKVAAKSCILVWLDGGPSHLETFDPKQDAPSEVRGPLGSIPTTIPGVHFSECLPKLATRVGEFAVLRSMTSPLGEHNFGTHYLMTGYKPTPVLEYPTFGATLAHLREPANRTSLLPPNFAVPNFRVGGSRLSGNGFLPSSVSPFSVGSDPAKPDFQVQDLDFFAGMNLPRLQRRREFVQAMNRFHRPTGYDSSATDSVQVDTDLERAFRLISSPEAKRAFRLEEEPDAIRRMYGSKSIGQSCLLARRLVERGVAFVTVNNRGWDTHADLNTRLKDGYVGAKVPVGLVPSLDTAVAALLDDLKRTGLIDETLVVVMGEFGRTPKLNTQGGRDHWPRVFSVLLAGGGIAGGQIVGSSDAVGESPVDDPITPSDLVATIFHCLGFGMDTELTTNDGRPVRLAPPDSHVIEAVLS